MSVLEHLKAVRGRIENGWTQGVWKDDVGCYCLWGAVRSLDLTHSEENEILGSLAKEIISIKSYRKDCSASIIIHYNDLPTTTKQDVLDVIDGAIKTLLSRKRKFPMYSWL